MLYESFSNFYVKNQLEAGGKPSTWLPPERLVEHTQARVQFLKSVESNSYVNPKNIAMTDLVLFEILIIFPLL